MSLETDLERYLARCAETPFCWGDFDCVSFCADWVDERAGTHHAEDLKKRFPYGSAADALRTLTEHGGFEPLVSEYLGFIQPPATLAPGDIALLAYVPPGEEGEQQLLGIVAPSQVLAPWRGSGVVGLPRDLIVGGWALPPRAPSQD